MSDVTAAIDALIATAREHGLRVSTAGAPIEASAIRKMLLAEGIDAPRDFVAGLSYSNGIRLGRVGGLVSSAEYEFTVWEEHKLVDFLTLLDSWHQASEFRNEAFSGDLDYRYHGLFPVVESVYGDILGFQPSEPHRGIYYWFLGSPDSKKEFPDFTGMILFLNELLKIQMSIPLEQQREFVFSDEGEEVRDALGRRMFPQCEGWYL